MFQDSQFLWVLDTGFLFEKMNLSKKALEEFKKIWKEEKGQELEDVVASEKARRLLELIQVIVNPSINTTTNYPLRERSWGGLTITGVWPTLKKSDKVNGDIPETPLEEINSKNF